MNYEITHHKCNRVKKQNKHTHFYGKIGKHTKEKFLETHNKANSGGCVVESEFLRLSRFFVHIGGNFRGIITIIKKEMRYL